MNEQEIHPLFLKGLQANLDYWQEKTADRFTVPLASLRQDFPNIRQAVDFGLVLPETAESAASLALQASFITDRVGNWQEWLPVLESLAGQMGAVDSQLHCQLLNRLGQLLRLSGQPQEAINCHQRMATMAQRLDDTNHEAFAYVELCTNHYALRQYEQAEAYGLQGLAIAGETAELDRARSVAWLTLAVMARECGQLETAEERARQGIALQKRLDNDPIHLARLLHTLGETLLNGQRYDEAITILQEALGLLATTTSELDKSRVVNSLGVVYFQMERYEEAEQAFRQADSTALRQSGDLLMRGAVLQNIGNAQRMRQQYDAALLHLERALAVWQQMGDPLRQTNTLTTIAALFSARNEAEAACDYWRQAASLLDQCPDIPRTQRMRVRIEEQLRLLCHESLSEMGAAETAVTNDLKQNQ
jgi:tetratricopeptide (TPR) repeat protein